MSHNHYFRDVSRLNSLDVYRLLELFQVTCPVAQHIVKKALAAGQRGHKDTRRDWQDIADSAARRLQMIDEDAGWTDDAIRAAAFGQQNTLDCRDPRTVEGVDDAFDGERHLNITPERRHCPDCSAEHCPCIEV
ncbi:MAG: hypothetical protein B7Z23_13530 [Pseudomonadales bacterium 32-61-5]|nr:MAG: hypothetical protein B7Z23_13530 [Pseudomonadales bacterium 32-61-5]